MLYSMASTNFLPPSTPFCPPLAEKTQPFSTLFQFHTLATLTCLVFAFEEMIATLAQVDLVFKLITMLKTHLQKFMLTNKAVNNSPKVF